MTNFEKNIHDAAREYSLSHEERAKMSRMIRSYMAMKPLRRTAYSASSVSWIVYLHRPIAAALVLVLISSASITYAAEAALPGDALYGVKTHVNEPLKVALATSAEAKADAHIEIAERRIEEAAVLASEGRLDANTEQSLATAFESSAQAARENIEATQTEDADASVEIASRFETRLLAHETVLAEVADNGHTREIADAVRSAGLAVAALHEAPAIAATLATGTATESEGAPTMSITTAAKSAPTDAVAARVASATKTETPLPSERKVMHMQSAAEHSLRSAEKALRSADKLSPDLRASIETDLTTAHDLMDAGSEQLEAKAYADAFTSFQSALQIAEQTIVRIKAAPVIEKARSRGASRAAEVRAGATVEIKAPVVTGSTTVTVPIVAPQSANAPHTKEEDMEESTASNAETKLKLDLHL